MQEYAEILGTELIKNSREKINNNNASIGSNFSGTAFPTQNLWPGMFCFREDLNELYMYTKTGNNYTWKLIFKIQNDGSVLVANATNAEYVEHDGKIVLPDGSQLWIE